MEGEEVCVDYGHGRRLLKRIYGFDCVCGGCTEVGSDVVSEKEGEKGGVDKVVEEGGEEVENRTS